MKKLTKDQVVKSLTKAAARYNSETVKYQADGCGFSRKNATYRNIAGQYKVRANIFTNHNGSFYFSPDQLHATSFVWWYMLTVKNGVLIRNTNGYSSCTAKHQSKLTNAMRVLGIKADIEVNCRANIRYMSEVQDHYNRELAELIVKMENCQKKSLPSYKAQLKALTKLMKKLQDAKVGVRFTKKDAAKALENARTSRIQRLSWKRVAKIGARGFAEERKAVSNGASYEVENLFPKTVLTLVQD